MTTETESIEALHLWLATKLPELRAIPGVGLRYDPADAEQWRERGWVPNVTTDGLAEHTPEEWDFSIESGDDGWHCTVLLGEGVRTFVNADGETMHIAMCRAVRKALEA